MNASNASELDQFPSPNLHPVKIFAAAVVILSLTGCCATKTVFSADGNVPTGTVGGTVAITACTPMEKEVASEMAQLSDWYRGHWDACGTNLNPTACRAELSKAYQEQQKLLLDVLAAMNGQPKAQQKKMYQQMRLKAPLIPK